MASLWFVKTEEKILGPFDGAKLRTLAAAGKLTHSMPVANSAVGPWTRASAIRGLFPDNTIPPPLPGKVPAQQPAPPAVAARAGVSRPLFPESPVPAVPAPDATTESAVSVASKNGGLAKLWGGIGSTIAVASLIALNVGLSIYNNSDAAAINLIKRSMQKTFSEEQGLPKPVKVLDVELKGQGQNRTGTATVKFGEKPHTIPFTAIVTKAGRNRALKVEWKAQNLPSSATIPTPSPQANSRPTARPVPSFDGTALQDQFREQFQAFMVALTAVSALEQQVGNEDTPLTPQQKSQALAKLVVAYADLQKRSVSLRKVLESAGAANSRDREAGRQKMLSLCFVIETSIPAMTKAINSILASNSDAEAQAHLDTYWTLNDAFASALEQLAPVE